MLVKKKEFRQVCVCMGAKVQEREEYGGRDYRQPKVTHAIEPILRATSVE